MFRITAGKGFHIRFDNGWTASVQFGTGNYCNNRSKFFDPLDGNLDFAAIDIEVGADGCLNAEIAAWDETQTFYNFGNDTAKGWVDPMGVLVFLNMIATMGQSK